VSGERHSGKGCFFKKRGNTLPRVLGMGHSGKRIFFKKIDFLPQVLHSGKRIFYKNDKFLSRVLHSGKSVRFLALGEDLFPVRGIPGSSSSSVALGEGFPECFCLFPESIWHSGKQVSAVVSC
jgi:hypothetical protein